MNTIQSIQQTVEATTKKGASAGQSAGQFASMLQLLTSISPQSDPIPQLIPKESESETSNEQLIALMSEIEGKPGLAKQLLDTPELQLLLDQEPESVEDVIELLHQVEQGEIAGSLETLERLPVQVKEALPAIITNVLAPKRETAIKEPAKETARMMPAVSLYTPLVKDSAVLEKATIEPKAAPDAEDAIGLVSRGEAKTEMQVTAQRPAKEALDLNDPRFDDRLRAKIEAALAKAPFTQGRDGATRLSIRLYPEQLGELVVQLERKDGELTVKLFTATESVKQAIEQQLGKLQQMLQQHAPQTRIETGIIASNAKDFGREAFDDRRRDAEYQEQQADQESEEEEDDE